jgi:hypothetical protein
LVQSVKEEQFVAIGEQWSQEDGEAKGRVAEYLFLLEGQPGAYYLIRSTSDDCASRQIR